MSIADKYKMMQEANRMKKEFDKACKKKEKEQAQEAAAKINALFADAITKGYCGQRDADKVKNYCEKQLTKKGLK